MVYRISTLIVACVFPFASAVGAEDCGWVQYPGTQYYPDGSPFILPQILHYEQTSCAPNDGGYDVTIEFGVRNLSGNVKTLPCSAYLVTIDFSKAFGTTVVPGLAPGDGTVVVVHASLPKSFYYVIIEPTGWSDDPPPGMSTWMPSTCDDTLFGVGCSVGPESVDEPDRISASNADSEDPDVGGEAPDAGTRGPSGGGCSAISPRLNMLARGGWNAICVLLVAFTRLVRSGCIRAVSSLGSRQPVSYVAR
jgi:hypothetical protein